MQLFNTLTRKKEAFAPREPGKVSMYVCGITAYDLSHVGHARSSVVFDVLARYLRKTGLDVTFVRNFTDVDDKIIKRANETGKTSDEIATTYMRAFHEDMDRLAVLRPDVEPLATEHIQEMVGLIENLIAKGTAYPTPSGDVYFRVRAYPRYGELSGRDIEDLQSGARVAPGEEKEDPLDFALWKAAKPGEPSWDSPWGKGRPGWHIECSAMSEKYVTLPLDIHGGGQDLVFPHHENEIAQTVAATGMDLSRYWVHNGFVQINQEKMSKSLGNFFTIRDILASYLPETLRFFLLTKHYRSPLDFSDEGLEEAERALKRIYSALAQIDAFLSTAKPGGAATPPEIAAELATLNAAVQDAFEDDLNTAAALGHIFGMVRLAGRIMEEKALKKTAGAADLLGQIKSALANWGQALGLFALDPATFLAELKAKRAERKSIDPAKVQALLDARAEARAAKDFARADALRAEAAAMGVEIMDSPTGQTWDVA